MLICEGYDEVWGPNDGCAEFMDAPEVIPCKAPAVVILEMGMFADADTDSLPMCERHAGPARELNEAVREGWVDEVVLL